LSATWAKVTERLRDPLVLFILVNVPFLFVFYDLYNLNTIAYAASYLSLGLNPYQYGNQIPGGLPIQLLGLVAYYVFLLSRSNYVVTAAVLKVLFLAITFLAGVALSRAAKLEGLTYHRKILYAFIFNPFVLFVNDVWVETDVIIICLVLLGYLALHYGWDRQGEVRYLVFGALCFGLAIFSYYSVAILVPTLVLYRPTTRTKLQTFGVLLAFGGLLAIPLLVFNLSALGSLFSGLQSSATGISPFSTVNLISPLSASALHLVDEASLVAILVGSVATPVLFKRYGKTEPVSMLVAYSLAFLLFVTDVEGDNFVLLIGLLLLAVVSLRSPILPYTRLLVLQLFLLPQFVIIQMANGAGGATGVFYWSYYLFHSAPTVYTSLGGLPTLKALLIVYVACLVGTVYYFVRKEKMRPRPDKEPSPTPASGPYKRVSGRGAPTGFILFVSVILVLCAVMPATFVADPGIGKPTGSISGFNEGLFLPVEYSDVCEIYPGCAYALPSSGTYQFSDSSSAVSFSASSVSVGLLRNMTDQSFTLNFTGSVVWGGDDPSPQSMDLVNTSAFYAGLSRALVINSSSAIAPQSSSLYSATSVGQTTLFSAPTPIYALDGTGILSYNLDSPQLVDHQFLFAVELNANAGSQNLLWNILAGNVTYEAFTKDNFFFLGTQATPSSSWTYAIAPSPVPLNRWLLAGFEMDSAAQNLVGFVNGVRLTVPLVSSLPATVALSVGKYGRSVVYDHQFSISGNVTSLFAESTTNSTFVEKAYVWTARTGTLTTFNSGNNLTVVVSGTAANPTIEGGPIAVTTGPFHDLWIGKLTDFDASVTISFAQVSIGSTSSGPNLVWIVVDFAVLIPAVVAAWCLYPSVAKRWARRRDDGGPQAE
jgi:hypothetical protein